MKEGPELIGRSYREEEKGSIDKTLREWSEESSETVEGELDKTEDELKMIETINSVIDSELKSLGIETYEPITPSKIHILSSNILKQKFPDSKGSSFFSSVDDVIYVNKDKEDTRIGMFSTLLHELVHRASKRKYYADTEDGIHDARVGYRIHSPWKEPGRQNRFRGFNELMTDYTVYKILIKKQEWLEDTLGITEEEIQGPLYCYMHYGPILEFIIKKIAIDKKISILEVFDNLERGQFQNNILILKDVERSFGKGALEILSLLQALKYKKDNDKLEEMIKDFFAEEDESGREGIRTKILAFVDKAEKEPSD